MHRYRRPAIAATAAFALLALVGASRHSAASATSARTAGAAALATDAGAPYLQLTGPAGGDIRLGNMAADIRAQDAYIQAVQAQAAAQQAAAQAQAAAAQRARSSSSAAGTSGGHACGGNLPPCCVMMRESKGNPSVVNGSSGAAGKWQFMPGTWNGYGGYATASQAPESVQDAKAAQVWAGGAGASNWGGGC